MPGAYNAAVASLAARVGDDIAMLADAACSARASTHTQQASLAVDHLVTVVALVVGLAPDELWGAVRELERARCAVPETHTRRSLRMH